MLQGGITGGKSFPIKRSWFYRSTDREKEESATWGGAGHLKEKGTFRREGDRRDRENLLL